GAAAPAEASRPGCDGPSAWEARSRRRCGRSAATAGRRRRRSRRRSPPPARARRPRAAAAAARAGGGDAGDGGRPRGHTAVGAQGGSLPPRTIAAMAANPLRHLPSVDALLADAAELVATYGRPATVDALRAALAEARAAGEARPGERLLARAEELLGRPPSLRPALNATGVIVHTNLGRAPLAAHALERARAVGSGYSNLEYDLNAGARGSRHDHLGGLLAELTGAETGMAVNNNAAAVLLSLAALASGREVVISRGELIEIGDGFRIPDILSQSGARLVEVGTTNRTSLRDYEAAIGPETAAIVRVHQSNFRMVGFTAAADLGELAELAARRDVALIDDLGSGQLLDLPDLADEPTA